MMVQTELLMMLPILVVVALQTWNTQTIASALEQTRMTPTILEIAALKTPTTWDSVFAMLQIILMTLIKVRLKRTCRYVLGFRNKNDVLV